MHPITQRVAGRLLLQDTRNGVIMQQLPPASESEDVVYLRYAMVTRGPGDHIFPAFILDDWGKEIRSLSLYGWVREHGDHFPRAEIFGYEHDGRETQAFLRAMELYARLPCYAYETPKDPIEAGHLLSAILLPEPAVDRPVRIKGPEEIQIPLRIARVTWWQIPPDMTDPDLARLDAEPGPGF